jgi:hypothetical protein
MDSVTIGILGREYAMARLSEEKCRLILNAAERANTAAILRRSEAYDMLTTAIHAHIERSTDDSK